MAQLRLLILSITVIFFIFSGDTGEVSSEVDIYFSIFFAESGEIVAVLKACLEFAFTNVALT